MTLASTLKQRQINIHRLFLEGQLRKIPLIQEANRLTEEFDNSPEFPIKVIVECLEEPSLFPPSKYECIGYEFIEEGDDYRIYRRVIKGLNQIANEDTEWTIKEIFDIYNMGAYIGNSEMVIYE